MRLIHIDALLKSAFPLSEISAKKEIPDNVQQVSVGGEFAEALMSHRATGSEGEPGPDLTRTGESALDKKWNLPLGL